MIYYYPKVRTKENLCKGRGWALDQLKFDFDEGVVAKYMRKCIYVYMPVYRFAEENKFTYVQKYRRRASIPQRTACDLYTEGLVSIDKCRLIF